MSSVVLAVPVIKKLINPQLHCVEIYYSEFTQIGQEVYKIYC